MNRTRIAFYIILTVFILYACRMIYLTSFDIGGTRWFTLADDPMVSMRYAKNLANGHGLVWNPGGEKIEGYTNPLWVVYMAMFHLLPIPAPKISLCIQISGMFFLILNLFAVRRITEIMSGGSGLAVFSASLFTACYLSLNYWSLHGFEISLLTLMISWSVLIFLKARMANRYTAAHLLCLAAGTLIRLDMVVPLIVTTAYQVFTEKKNRFKTIGLFLLLAIVFVGGQTIVRYLYYGDWLPNSYYLKMTGISASLRISRGFFVYVDFLRRFIWLLVLFALFALSLPNRNGRLLLLLFLGQSAYSIYVGGDAWEWFGLCNRFIVIVMPLLFVLTGLTLGRLHQFLAETEPIKSRPYLPAWIAGIFIILAVPNINETRSSNSLTDWLLTENPFEEFIPKWKVITGLTIKQITTPDARIAEVWAGTMPYFLDRTYIDLLGKNDRKIARQKVKAFHEIPLDPKNPTQSRYSYFIPGHLKWNYAYSIGELKPDVIAQLWENQQEAAPYIRDYIALVIEDKIQILLKKDSRQILWDKLGVPEGAGG